MPYAAGAQVALLAQLRHVCDDFLKLLYRSIDLAVPELPFQGADLFIQDDRFIGPFVAPAHDIIGDLLQWLDFHGDVEPVNDMPRWTRQTAWQPLHNLRAVGQHRDFAAARVTLPLERLKRS